MQRARYFSDDANQLKRYITFLLIFLILTLRRILFCLCQIFAMKYNQNESIVSMVYNEGNLISLFINGLNGNSICYASQIACDNNNNHAGKIDADDFAIRSLPIMIRQLFNNQLGLTENNF